MAQVLPLLVAVGSLLAAAGTLRWWRGYAALAVVAAVAVANNAWVRRHNPELPRVRRSVGAGTKKWDLWWLGAFWFMVLAVLVVGALDGTRFGWAPAGWAWFPAGVAVFGAGMALSAWAMGQNPFFEGTVRIQTDRGQRVIDTGPYAYLRHPGYLGLMLIVDGLPWMLGSWWALAPALLASAWLVVRTHLEDAMLRRELPGYEAYAARVRGRLLPRPW